MTLNECFAGLAPLSSLLFLVTGMLAMGMSLSTEKGTTMIHTTIIFSLIVFAAGIALAYERKITNGRQTRKVRSEVRIDSYRIVRK
jgi:hypothetical protein